MKNLILIIICLTFFISCKSKITNSSTPFTISSDVVYSEITKEGKCKKFYYFNYETNMLYVSKDIEISNEINKIKAYKTSIYGKFEVTGDVIKIQHSPDKLYKHNTYFSSIIFMFIPMRRTTTTGVIGADEVVTEGVIKKDSLIMIKEYLGQNKLNFKKKYLSKTKTINKILILEPNYKGKNDEQTILIVSNS